MSQEPHRSAYHHGALRDELMAACLRLIEDEGIGAVSLRRVAREVGVSSGAPYHHFADRAALLSALSVQGFEELGERLRLARDTADTPQRAIGALVDAYVRFAVERRAHFLLMFRPELTGSDKHPDVRSAGDAAFDVLTEVVRESQYANLESAGGTAALLALVWAAAHGLAALWLDGPLAQRSNQLGTRPEQLTEDVARTLAALFAAAQPAVAQPGAPVPDSH